ncbi:MAG: tRNA lysidine(34) synthetase TilS [Muribaculaceae bacterium]|nr:tRNA lysidine(34) synthetase TilS [Muribaculaceae bacterium]
MSVFIHKIKRSINSHKLLHENARVIVTLSGGADSVALLSVLVSLGYDCIAAHCNFHLRGNESDRDCSHAIAVAERLGVKCHVKDFDVPAYENEHGVSTEMACRELRYKWFEELRKELDAEAIAVAHHQDDNIETFFLNLLRGTGIAGLTGMSPRNGFIIRPMLDCTRLEVERYLGECGLEYVTDSTNLQNDFSRNRLRNIILPAISENFPDASKTIASTIGALRENEAIYRRYVESADKQYRHGDNIDLSALIANEPNSTTMLFELIRPYGFNYTQAGNIIEAARQSGKQFFAEDYTALINRDSLLISHNAQSDSEHEYIIDLNHDVDKPIALSVTISDTCDMSMATGTGAIALDADVLKGNPCFKLRHWQKGDRLAPFGMRGTKKLSDIFSDAKLSRNEKSKVWVLTRNDEILGVVGLRASRHFPVSPNTKQVVILTTN